MFTKKVFKLIAAIITVTIIALSTLTAFAASTVLKQLYVDYDAVKKIIIDGVEKTPPDDMKPFIANGRTYVALRYISDAFGKEINFDPKTGVITIGSVDKEYTDSMKMSSSDDFSGTLKNWYTDPEKNKSLGSWRIDGPNGLACTAKYKGNVWNTQFLNYKDIYQIGSSYTQEVDIALPDINCDISYNEYFAGLGAYGDKDDYFCNIVAIGNGAKTGYIKIGTGISDKISLIEYKKKFEPNTFYTLKTVSDKDRNVDIYIDGEYVSSFTSSSGVLPAIGLWVSNKNASGKNYTCYFKNYKVTCNEK
jgi:hypothetical protein